MGIGSVSNAFWSNWRKIHFYVWKQRSERWHLEIEHYGQPFLDSFPLSFNGLTLFRSGLSFSFLGISVSLHFRWLSMSETLKNRTTALYAGVLLHNDRKQLSNEIPHRFVSDLHPFFRWIGGLPLIGFFRRKRLKIVANAS